MKLLKKGSPTIESSGTLLVISSKPDTTLLFFSIVSGY